MGTTDRTPFPETPGLEPPVERTDFFSSSPVLFSSGHSSGREVKAYVTRDQIRLARKADLAGFLLQRHPDLFRSSGSSLYMKYRDSLYIRKGFPGYTDFSSGRHGNPIDFLTGFLGYSFVDAVSALTGGPSCGRTSRIPRQEDAPPSPIVLPASAKKPYRMVYAYLLGRGIPAGMIRLLEERGLLYQDRDHGNAVFVNPERDCCELRGTLTYASRPFHGCLKTRPDRFWYFMGSEEKPGTAYLCESAIDAVSLFLLHKRSGTENAAVYISIGGVSNQKTIERVESRIHSVLAVDNDHAGDLCRERNPDMESIIPSAKDWNEDLQLLKQDPGDPIPPPRPL